MTRKRSTRPSAPVADLHAPRFRWKVASDYVWVDALHAETREPGRYLIPAGDVDEPTEWRQPPGDLFRILARCEPTEDGVAAFAREFGQLGFAVPILPRSRRSGPLAWSEGETLADWAKAIADLAGVVEQLDARDEKDDGFAIIRDQQLAKALTQGLREHVPLAVVRGHDGFEMTHDVKTLLSFCWSQLVRVAVGEVGYVRCRGCGKLLLLSVAEGGYRKQRTTCSVACRMKFQRDRVRLAKERKAAGASVREIADELDMPAKSVTIYLKKG
jgi:hypothetical protein